jgi:hypothetical protein
MYSHRIGASGNHTTAGALGMDMNSALLGSWHLTGWSISGDAVDGGVRYPFGPDATGVLTYTADGRMSAIVARRDRPNLPGPKPRDGTDAELAAALLSFFCYAGWWRIDGETVVHEVDFALNPNLLGTEQRRRISLFETAADGAVVSGTVLELSADEPTARGMRHHRLIWQRD